MNPNRTASDRDVLDMQVWDYSGLPKNHTKTFNIECFAVACDHADFDGSNNLCTLNEEKCPKRYDALLGGPGRSRRSYQGIIQS